MSNANKKSQITDIPTEMAEAWAAVIMSLADHFNHDQSKDSSRSTIVMAKSSSEESS